VFVRWLERVLLVGLPDGIRANATGITLVGARGAQSPGSEGEESAFNTKSSNLCEVGCTDCEGGFAWIL
jgi:hypothetical protein